MPGDGVFHAEAQLHDATLEGRPLAAVAEHGQVAAVRREGRERIEQDVEPLLPAHAPDPAYDEPRLRVAKGTTRLLARERRRRGAPGISHHMDALGRHAVVHQSLGQGPRDGDYGVLPPTRAPLEPF